MSTQPYNNDHAAINPDVSKERTSYDYGGNPLAHYATNDPDIRLRPFGGAAQPGLYRPPPRTLANPAPLGLSAFALTTFVLSVIQMGTRSILEPNIVVALAYGYGGLVQLLAGMWEMACGNTFGATALSSYGGFWISFGIILTPGGFGIVAALEESSPAPFTNSFGLYLMGWFIFTFLLLLCTLRSTVAFFSLFFFLDMAFLLLGLSYLYADAGHVHVGLERAGGAFACLSAIMAWYNALAGLADSTNSFFVIPVLHFPWSETGRERRNNIQKSPEHQA
ncbi:glyoxylate pathway regulator [Eremomyces bilateralis CBS 781.70]|uniref:Glyoxylate pathway regulator n=1 Tax=Eremomyces bilateralis CBS 781.70 TaxID=1392243 RepID=A0A6G1GHF8_9PEZI|nr:glyoxylate pathway regulator [Eremomyces bilateralis CBS 781.70]KAF1817376.1 glyoxylate pathway regulator [Eremomyces bilateralis CBS 781.70]